MSKELTGPFKIGDRLWIINVVPASGFGQKMRVDLKPVEVEIKAIPTYGNSNMQVNLRSCTLSALNGSTIKAKYWGRVRGFVSKEDAIEGYNEEIDKAIQMHKTNIATIQSTIDKFTAKKLSKSEVEAPVKTKAPKNNSKVEI